jgi:DNA topoisomerase I
MIRRRKKQPAEQPAPPPDPRASAREAGLRYVSTDRPGLTRERRGEALVFLDLDRRPVEDPQTLARLKALAIPPAWTEVWISPLPNGHLQATGRDARGRKQYRYHARWRAVREELKYGRMARFGALLPGLRQAVDGDLGLRGLPRDKVLALLVRLLDQCAPRVGNPAYARENDSFGLTTLRPEHARVEGSLVQLRYRGKGGRCRSIGFRDRRLARILRRLQDLPGQYLFEYLDEAGRPHPLESGDLNAYLRGRTGEPFTAKDFRTWAGSVIALAALAREPPEGPGDARRKVTAAVEAAAEALGNTKAICRKSYIHPRVLSAYLDDSDRFFAIVQAAFEEEVAGLDRDERAFLRLLEPGSGA